MNTDRSNDFQVGSVSHRSNDTRQKEKGAFVWNSLYNSQSVYLGDSIYSGKKSEITVTLRSGGNVNIGENSLVTFENIGNQSVLDLEAGKFQLKVNGTMKVAVQGELMTIDGNNSNVQIVVEKNKKPQIKVIDGDAKFKKDTSFVKLDTNIIAKPLNYNWKLYDLFVKIDEQIFEKETPPAFVSLPNKISWSQMATKPAMVDWANNPNFRDKLSYQAPAEGLDLNKAFIGDNFWRISFDGTSWSKTQKFTLTTSYIKGAEPVPDALSYEVPFLTDSVSVTVPLETTIEPIGYVVQASVSDQFLPSKTKSFWSPKSQVNLSFYKPGEYFYRFRSVNKNQEISRWSKVVKFNVFTPEAPRAPAVAKDYIEGTVGDRISVNWKSNPTTTRFEILDDKNKKIKRAQGNSFTWVPTEAGVYKARAYQVNKYGLQSPSSKFVKIIINPKELPIAQNKKKLNRRPAYDKNAIATKYEVPKTRYINERYKYSQMAVQGMLWTIQSTDQKENNIQPPYATGLGIHGYLWKGHHGFEGSIKSGVFGVNSAGKEGSSLKSLEPRYHYRFIARSPFRFTREFMPSLFAGYELYRNNAENISNQYDLIKFGTSIEFPLGSHWTSGGEFVYGFGTDGSNKFEMSGNANFFFDPEWSFGGGYRLHLFEAGAGAASPTGLLPYREGYTELFSVLNYYF